MISRLHKPFSFTRGAAVVALLLGTGAASLRAALPENLNFGLRELAKAYKTANKAAGKTVGTVKGGGLSHEQIRAVLDGNPRARADEQDRVIVDIYLDGSASIDEVASNLEAVGCKIESRVDWYGHGALAVWLPLDQAGKAGRMRGVKVVDLSLKPRTHLGKVTNQATFVHKVEALVGTTATTTQQGRLGAGVTVGVLSDSFNQLKTTGTGTTTAPLYANVKAADDVASFDLPGSANHPYGNTTPVNVLKDATTGEDEGRAMLQLIHDVVPQAKLAFYTAFVSEVDFAAGIVALQQQGGCNVICDDVGYFDEPMFSDGIVGQAVDRVVAAGAVYTSSAGNDDASGYVGDFTPVTNDATSQAALTAQGVPYTNITAAERGVLTDFHAFGTRPDGTPILVQNIRIPGTSADAAGVLAFQWDDPYLAQNGNAVTTDFDILVFNAAGALQATRSGQANNTTTGRPLELPNTNLNPAVSYKVVIVRTSRTSALGANANRATHLRYTVSTNDTPVRGDFINIASPETHGHNHAAGCIGTAAYRYDASPVPDVHDPTHPVYPIVEQFSSNGPVNIYFDAVGNRIPGVQRKQPVLSAVDANSTTFFPPDSVTSGTTPPPVPGPANPSPFDFNGDGYPNFFGTSAAAPNAAAIAAILVGAGKERGVTLTPTDVRSLLTSTTQGNSDQTPNYVVGTAGPVTVTASGYSRADNNAYTVAYNGAAGTTLSSITIDLSTIGVHFDTTTSIPTDASTTATATGVVVSVFNGTTTPAGFTAPSVASFTVGTGVQGTATSLLTINFNNFNPGATLKFGIGRRNDGTNIFAQLAEVLGGQTSGSPGALLGATTSAGATSSGRFSNTFKQKWNYKTGYGLIDAQAATNLLLSSLPPL